MGLNSRYPTTPAPQHHAPSVHLNTHRRFQHEEYWRDEVRSQNFTKKDHLQVQHNTLQAHKFTVWSPVINKNCLGQIHDE